MDRSRANSTIASARVALAALAVLATCLPPEAIAGSGQAAAPAAPAARTARESRAALDKAVADYVGLYTRATLDRWKGLFHASLVVAYPGEKGTIRARGLDEFFKAQKDYFETGRAIAERLENIRIDAGSRIARVSADFVFVDEGQESRGKLGLHLVETTDGWKITSVVFAYDES
jgi:hypothetical protein